MIAQKQNIFQDRLHQSDGVKKQPEIKLCL